MARDIGPEMLRDLERQLQEGVLDQYAYEARRVQVLELVRKGKAVKRSPFLVGLHWFMVVAFALLALAIAIGNVTAGIFLGIPLLLVAYTWWRIALRGRPSR